MKRILLLFVIFASCTDVQEENIIKEVSRTQTQSVDISKRTLNYFLDVEQCPDYKGYHVYTITPDLFRSGDKYDKLFSTGEPFKYTKYFKVNDTYVFLNRLEGLKHPISKAVFNELYIDDGVKLESSVVVVVINVQNYKHVVIHDNHRYLPVDSLLLESTVIIEEKLK